MADQTFSTDTPSVDPAVTMPASVRAAAERANAMHQQAYNPPADGEVVTQQGNEPPADQLKFQEAPKEQPKPKDQKPADWEHKYNSLKPRYDRMQEDVRIMSEQISSLQAALASRPTTPPAASDVRFNSERLVTPEEVRDYGDELLNVVGKKAKDELNPVVQQLQAKIAELEGKFGGVSNVIAQGEQERMFAHLDTTIPTWRTLNTDPNFLSWLGLTDPFSGAIRRELLTAAFKRNNAHQVAAFFNGFLTQEAATSPAGGASAGRGLTPPRASLESFAAPGRAKAAAPNPPAEKPTFTHAQIAAFYHDVQTGRYAGRAAEKDALEAQIFAAGREGRVR
jgi:hypothetical protein